MKLDAIAFGNAMTDFYLPMLNEISQYHPRFLFRSNNVRYFLGLAVIRCTVAGIEEVSGACSFASISQIMFSTDLDPIVAVDMGGSSNFQVFSNIYSSLDEAPPFFSVSVGVSFSYSFSFASSFAIKLLNSSFHGSPASRELTMVTFH